jgi:molybdopterin-guanine dinucleotide biosynthesis protein A
LVAVVLAGGTSRRWGGVDKTALTLAGAPILLHAVSAVLPFARAVVVVAPAEHPARPAVDAAAARAGCPLAWTREDPPGSGPVAGLAVGVAALPASVPAAGSSDPPTRWVAVLAGDLPFTRAAWPRLVAALEAQPDGAVGVDPSGHRQHLLAVYREAVLRERLSAVRTTDQPLRIVTAGLMIIDVPVTDAEAHDLDTPEDAVIAERMARQDSL